MLLRTPELGTACSGESLADRANVGAPGHHRRIPRGLASERTSCPVPAGRTSLTVKAQVLEPNFGLRASLVRRKAAPPSSF